MNIIAVVVTYNRLNLLKRTIESLQRVPEVGRIIVVNNGSTDGTHEWLAAQKELTVVNQENVGGSGGFYTGMQRAYNEGADWVWCMDDDVFPTPGCLKALLEASAPDVGILCPQRMQEGKLFVTECRTLNLSNPWKSLHRGKLTPENAGSVTDITGMVFEGPLIRREVIAQIGLPNKELFIFYDDTDYAYRAVLAGWKVRYVPAARMDKALFFTQDTWEQKQQKKKWKRMYQTRNSAYFNHHYGKNSLVRYGRPFTEMAGYVLLAFFSALFSKAYALSDIPRFWRAYRDGIGERLGRM